MRTLLAAMLCLSSAAGAYLGTHTTRTPRVEIRHECKPGFTWSDTYGCQDVSYEPDLDCEPGEDEGCPARTCAECSTDSECDALCGVPACKEEGEAGCWMPDDLKNPTTRTWWRE